MAKVITHLVIDMATGNVLEEKSHEYEGPWTLCGGGGGAPPAPDPWQAAQAQTQENIDTANAVTKLNRYNQSTPYGNLTWSQDGNGQWTQTQTLDPRMQALQDQNLQNSAGLQGAIGSQLNQVNQAVENPININQLPGVNSQAHNLQDAAGIIGNNTASTAAPATAGAAGAGQVGQNWTQGLTGVGYGNQQLNPLQAPSDQTRNDVTNALYNQAMSRLQPDQQNATDAMKSQLANQGIAQNSEAWNRAMDDLQRNQTDQTNQAMYSAIGQGTSAMQAMNSMQLQDRQQLAGEAMGKAQLGAGIDTTNANNATQASITNANNATQTGIADMNAENSMNQFNATMGFNTGQAVLQGGGTLQNQQMAAQNNQYNLLNSNRNNAINTLSALRGGGMMGVQSPNFSGENTSVNMNPADISGNMYNSYNGQMAAWQQQQQSQGQMFGGLAGLGAAAIMFSDSRLKTAKRALARDRRGFRIYEFEYKTEPGVKYTGVIAQEVQSIVPEAVLLGSDGYLRVNYQVLFGGQPA